jgi:RNA polymerase sigma-70 factor (ECF subfamily)
MEQTSPLALRADADDRGKEIALVRAAQADPAAFGVLYQRYFTRVYWYLRARTSTAEDASDLAQQVFLHALEALPRYRERGLPFAAWLFRIARNGATNFGRRQRLTLSWEQLPVASADTAPDPEAQALHNDDLRRLGAHLATLPPEKRDYLALRFAAGLTIPEIAAVVGKREAAVRKQITRTLHALKDLSEKEQPDARR